MESHGIVLRETTWQSRYYIDISYKYSDRKNCTCCLEILGGSFDALYINTGQTAGG
jgi:hypothetical protein